MNSMSDWPLDEAMRNMAAEELSNALATHGVHTLSCSAEDDGIDVGFDSLRDAETMLTLAVPGNSTSGSLYDRASGGCVSITNAGADSMDLESARAVLGASWDWLIHPDITGRRVGWHVSVTMPVGDAFQVAVNLNSIGGV